jgi:transcriptional antiterminator RfaH
MIHDQSRWYVVQTQANAVANRARQGLATYLPRYLKHRQHARPTDVVTAPPFPRYLFVKIGMTIQRWRSIHSTVGVSRLVSNGDCPAPVPEHVDSLLRSRENASGFIQLDHRPKFTASDKIRVVEGAFYDCLAACRTVNASRFFSICSAARSACC